MQLLLENLLAWPLVTLVRFASAAPLVWLLSRALRHQRPDNAALGLALITALLLPWTYAAAQAGRYRAELKELIAFSRLGEAHQLAIRLGKLDASYKLDGVPISQIAAELELAVRELERQTALPLTAGATAPQQVLRARQLAMLGRNAEADATIRAVPGPEAAILRATMLETQNQWQTAHQAYTIARQEWERRPASTERTDGIAEATQGIAYTLRKSGRYTEAEAAYLGLLAIRPTAETHFLLAQFYEDAQNAERARHHARQAISLAPEAFRSQGERLIEKLRVYHFGCLSVYRADAQ